MASLLSKPEVRYYWPLERNLPYLSEDRIKPLLARAGWPNELIPDALSVISQESGGLTQGSFYELKTGSSWGMFQLYHWTWADYCEIEPAELLDPLTNAECAYLVYLYDLENGQSAWNQWEAKP